VYVSRNRIVILFFKVRDKGDLKRTVTDYVYRTHATEDI
jgi:hypothetical protein